MTADERVRSLYANGQPAAEDVRLALITHELHVTVEMLKEMNRLRAIIMDILRRGSEGIR